MSVLFWPDIRRAPRIPVRVVCGPPAAGKSHYVRGAAGPRDIVIDLDAIIREMGGAPRGEDWPGRRQALEERNRRLQALADEASAPRAWLITTAPAGNARERWARLLRAAHVDLLLTPEGICRARILADPDRRRASVTQLAVLERWWRMYYPARVDRPVKIPRIGAVLEDA